MVTLADFVVIDNGSRPKSGPQSLVKPRVIFKCAQTGALPAFLSASTQALSVSGADQLQVQIGYRSALVWLEFWSPSRSKFCRVISIWIAVSRIYAQWLGK